MARIACFVGLLALTLTAGAQTRDRTLTVEPAQAVAGEARHALVIGNSAYTHGSLRNPVNDARGMAKALGEAGFNVLLLEDATQAAMQRAVRTFGDRIAKGGVGLFYYAGHGIQMKGRNYLIPVNADIAREYEIEFGSIDVNLVLAMMDSAKNALNIVILDACRNNPFARNFRSMQAGLAQMDAPTGTFIAFATAPGSVAADGSGDNGVYTKHLLAEMARPGMPIELMFKQVRNSVMNETRGQQIPWESSSMRGEFAFRPGVAAPSVADAVAEAVKRERQEMEKVLQAALERQRKELVAAGLVAVAAPSAPAPVITASVAPAPAAQLAGGRLPKRGDVWTYRLDEPRRKTSRQYTATVAAASPTAILEHYFVERGPSGEWVHAPGNYIVDAGASVFAPYLVAFQDLAPSARVRGVQMHDKSCTGYYRCEASGKVVGPETITVPAGRFDTIKIVLEHSWVPYAGAFGGLTERNLTVWYAPEVKRAVKFSSRSTFGKGRGGGHQPTSIETDFELELASYKLN